MTTCINLAERFGKRYRIGFDPAYSAKHVPRDKLDPWMMLIPTRVGCIVPHGGEMLVAEVDGHRRIKARLAKLDCCELYQDGDDFGAFLFDVADFARVAKIVRPHRKPRLTEQQRQEAAERLARYHFRPAVTP